MRLKNNNLYGNLKSLFSRMYIIVFLGLFFLGYPKNEALAQGETIFKTNILHEVRFYSLSPATWDTIVARYPRKEYTLINVKIDGTRIDSVGVRIKGNNYHISQKKKQALKIDFNEFVKKKKIDGLKKINLNNRDLLANHLTYKLCRDNGLAAPRTSFAKVYFDDELIGNYFLLEQINSAFCKQNFGNKKGNRYKALNKGAVLRYLGNSPDAYSNIYVKKNNEKKNDFSDLMRFLNFLSNSSNNDFENHIDEYIDFNNFSKALAIEMLVCKRDAFYVSGRNYYLYYNTEKSKFEYIVDDFDYSYSIHILQQFDLNFEHDGEPNYPATNNAFIKRIIASAKLRKRYYDAVCNIIHNGFNSKSYENEIKQLLIFSKNNNFNFTHNREIEEFVNDRVERVSVELKSNGAACTATSANNISSANKTFLFQNYPNPFSNSTTIEFFLKKDEIIKLLVYNTAGEIMKVIASQKLNAGKHRFILNTSLWQPGLYLCRVDTKGGSFTKKMQLIK